MLLSGKHDFRYTLDAGMLQRGMDVDSLAN